MRQERAPGAAPVAGQLELVGADLVGIVAILVAAAQISERDAEIADAAGFDLGARRRAPAGDVVGGGVADIL